MKTVRIKDKHNMQPCEVYEGEPIENKVRRIVDEKEPIEDGAPLIYQERKDGVAPQFNIRTDRWDIAIAAMDKVSQAELSKFAKTQENPADLLKKDEKKMEPDAAKDASKEPAA